MGNYMDEDNDIDSEEDESGEEENGEIEEHTLIEGGRARRDFGGNGRKTIACESRGYLNRYCGFLPPRWRCQKARKEDFSISVTWNCVNF